MYRDRRLLRGKRIPVRLNEYEDRELQEFLDLTGEEEAAALRQLAMERLKQIKEEFSRAAVA